jgi:hypothetical protein
MTPVEPRMARREGFEPPTARSVAWCSASVWTAPDGSGLLTLDGSSIWSDLDRSRRIVWMINRMIKALSTEDRMARYSRAVVHHADYATAGVALG